MKKTMAVILSCMMLLSTFTVVYANSSATETTVSQLSEGDKIIIGSYKGYPVEYTVEGDNEDLTSDGKNERFIISSQIITYKEFDNHNTFIVDTDNFSYKENGEGNVPTLRTWLNARTKNVNYYEGADPSYADQPGFLSALAKYEYDAIVDVTIKSAITQIDAGNRNDTDVDDGNGGKHWLQKGDREWPAAYTSVDNVKYTDGAYVLTTGKVFIPSIGDLYKYGGRTLNGGNDTTAGMAFMNVPVTGVAQAEALASSYPGDKNQLISLHKTLFRDISNFINTNYKGRRIASWFTSETTGNISGNGCNMNTPMGIRPCMYLASDTNLVKDADSDVWYIKKTAVEPTTIEDLLAANEHTAGGKIQIGTYGGAPVEYTVWGKKDADGDGANEIFLASSNVISYKEMHTSNAAGTPYKDMSWKDDSTGAETALRTWLNSTAAEGEVVYGTNVAPSYASQAGFLSTLEDYELSAVVKAKIKSRKRSDTGSIDGGERHFLIQTGHTWPEVLEGKNKDSNHNEQFGKTYEEASYVLTEDKVFIPSMQEIIDFAGNTQAAAIEFMNVSATQYAAENEGATGAPSGLNFETNKLIYLRDQVFYSGDNSIFANWLLYKSAVSASVNIGIQTNKGGIRPCMYLKANTEVEEIGNGVYQIKNPADNDGAVEPLTFAEETSGSNTQISVDVYNEGDATIDYTVYIAEYVTEGGEATLSVKHYPITVPAGAHYCAMPAAYNKQNKTIKVFLWDTNTLKPISANK